MNDGLDGLSAFDIAVSHGFTGTEADWLASLKGEPGASGEPGATVSPDDMRAMVAEAIAQLPIPPAGPQGERGGVGPPGPSGPPGPAAGAALDRPWRSVFERDELTKLVSRVVVGPAAGAPVLEMIPVRDADDLMRSIDILPLMGARNESP